MVLESPVLFPYASALRRTYRSPYDVLHPDPVMWNNGPLAEPHFPVRTFCPLYWCQFLSLLQLLPVLFSNHSELLSYVHCPDNSQHLLPGLPVADYCRHSDGIYTTLLLLHIPLSGNGFPYRQTVLSPPLPFHFRMGLHIHRRWSQVLSPDRNDIRPLLCVTLL